MSVLGAGAKSTFNPNGKGPTDVIAYPNINQVFGSTAAKTAISNMQGNVSAWAASQAGSGLSKEALEQIFKIQADIIGTKNAPVAELFFNSGYPECVSPSS